MDRPFRELHELWKIVYERAEAEAARQKAEEEKRKAEEQKTKAEEKSKGGLRPRNIRQPPSDAKNMPTNPIASLSPLQAEQLEDMLEESIGGVM